MDLLPVGYGPAFPCLHFAFPWQEDVQEAININQAVGYFGAASASISLQPKPATYRYLLKTMLSEAREIMCLHGCTAL